MARFDADAVVETSEVNIEGKVYKVPPISAKVLRRITEFQSTVADDDPTGPAKLLGILLNADWQDFEDTDVRKIKAVIEFVSPKAQEEQKKTSTIP